MMERYEEMNRMREHVFKEFDKNKDWLISYEEFKSATEQAEFEKPNEEDFKVSVLDGRYRCFTRLYVLL